MNNLSKKIIALGTSLSLFTAFYTTSFAAENCGSCECVNNNSVDNVISLPSLDEIENENNHLQNESENDIAPAPTANKKNNRTKTTNHKNIVEKIALVGWNAAKLSGKLLWFSGKSLINLSKFVYKYPKISVMLTLIFINTAPKPITDLCWKGLKESGKLIYKIMNY